LEPLEGDNGAEINHKYGLCLEHLTALFGDRIQGSVALLLARGVIMVCRYAAESAYKVRVEVRSAQRSELAKCQSSLEMGRVYKHSTSVYRWSCSSLADLHGMGSLLMQYVPALGIFLQSYVIQPDKTTRSAYAEAFMTKMDARTVHILRHL
jgi:hypothetical protein